MYADMEPEVSFVVNQKGQTMTTQLEMFAVSTVPTTTITTITPISQRIRDTPPAQWHSETSVEAAEKAAGRAEQDRARVYFYLKAEGLHGGTDEEIQLELNMPGNTERPRRWELSQAEPPLICLSGQTRKNRSGRRAAVWVVRDQTMENMR